MSYHHLDGHSLVHESLDGFGDYGDLSGPPSQPSMLGGMALQAISMAFDPVLRPMIKVLLIANPGASNWKIFNAVRFNDLNISADNAKKRAKKKDYIEPYKAFRNALNAALKKANSGKELANVLRFHVYRLTDQERSALGPKGAATPKASVAPAAAAAPFVSAPPAAALLQPMRQVDDEGADDEEDDDKGSKFPTTIVVVGLAAAAALLLMRKKAA